MSKGNQNKFLTIYFAVLGVGALGLGYMAWSASGSADEARTTYENKLRELDRLEGAKLSRTKDNADKKKSLVEDYVKQVQELNQKLMAYQAPVNDEEKGDAFQKQLKDAKDKLIEEAKTRQVILGEKFDLGMGNYLSEFPIAGAAGRLSAQLQALVFLTEAAMEAGVMRVDSLTRAELPFEKEAAAQPTAAPGAKPKKDPPKTNAKKDTAAKAPVAPLLDENKVLDRQAVTLTVTGRNRALLKLLETLANTSPEKAPHFFVVRTLQIENEKKEGAPKTFNVEVKEEKDPANKDEVVKTDAQFLLGDEKVMMRLDLDLIRFVPEQAPADKGKPAAKTASN